MDDAWGNSRIVRDHKLPSGMVVDCECPDLDAYAALELIPNPLISIAEEFRATTDVAEAAPGYQTRVRKLQLYIIATHLRKPDLVAEFGEPDEDGKGPAVEWVARRMTAMDRQELWNTIFLHGLGVDLDPELLKKLTEATSEKHAPPGAAGFREKHRGAKPPSAKRPVQASA